MFRRGPAASVVLAAALAASLALSAPPVAAAGVKVGAAAGSSQSGPVFRYDFRHISAGEVLDSSGHGINATLVHFPAPPPLTVGPDGRGQSLFFNGSRSQYLSVEPNPLLEVNRFTIAAWVRYKPNIHDDRWEVMEKEGEYWLNIRTDTRRVRVGGIFDGCTGTTAAPVWRYLDSAATIPAGTWVYLAGTYDGAALRIYINGAADSSLAVSGDTCNNGRALAVGAKNDILTGRVEAYWDGDLDDVRLYRRALAAAEIRRVMRSGER